MVQVSTDFLVDLCRSGGAPRMVIVVEHGLPIDARYVETRWNPEAHCYYAVVESESFLLVEPGASIPVVPAPVFKVAYEETR